MSNESSSGSTNYLNILSGPYVGDSFDSIHKMLDEQTAEHQKQVDDMEQKKAALETIRDKATTPYSKALLSYFDKSINSASDELMRNGMNSVIRQKVKDLIPTYSKTVVPVSTALAAKDAMSKAQESMNLRYPESQFDINPNNESLDKFILNPSLKFDFQNGETVAKKSIVAFSAIQNDLRATRGGRNFLNIFGQYYFTRKNEYGMTDREIVKGMLMDPNVPSILKDTYNNLYQSSKTYKWGNRYEDDRTISYIMQAMVYSLAKPDWKDLEDTNGLDAARAKRAAQQKLLTPDPIETYVDNYDQFSLGDSSVNDYVDNLKAISNFIKSWKNGTLQPLGTFANHFDDDDVAQVKSYSSTKKQAVYVPNDIHVKHVLGMPFSIEMGPNARQVVTKPSATSSKFRITKPYGFFKLNGYEYCVDAKNTVGDADAGSLFYYRRKSGTEDPFLMVKRIDGRSKSNWWGWSTDAMQNGSLEGKVFNKDSYGRYLIPVGEDGLPMTPGQLWDDMSSNEKINNVIDAMKTKSLTETRNIKNADGSDLWTKINEGPAKGKFSPKNWNDVANAIDKKYDDLSQFNLVSRTSYKLDVKPELQSEVIHDIVSKGISHGTDNGLIEYDDNGERANNDAGLDKSIANQLLDPKAYERTVMIFAPSGEMYLLFSPQDDKGNLLDRRILKVTRSLWYTGAAMDPYLAAYSKQSQLRENAAKDYWNSVRNESEGKVENSSAIDPKTGKYLSKKEYDQIVIQSANLEMWRNANAIFQLMCARVRSKAKNTTGTTAEVSAVPAADYESYLSQINAQNQQIQEQNEAAQQQNNGQPGSTQFASQPWEDQQSATNGEDGSDAE